MSFLDDKDKSLPHDAFIHPVADDGELNALNDTWRDLLGVYNDALSPESASTPQKDAQSTEPVVADPWGELLHAQGVELVDLQTCRPPKVQVSFSEQEVEQALQFLQEQ